MPLLSQQMGESASRAPLAHEETAIVILAPGSRCASKARRSFKQLAKIGEDTSDIVVGFGWHRVDLNCLSVVGNGLMIALQPH